MKDLTGKKIKIGDVIAFPFKKGLLVRPVLDINEDEQTVKVRDWYMSSRERGTIMWVPASNIVKLRKGTKYTDSISKNTDPKKHYVSCSGCRTIQACMPFPLSGSDFCTAVHGGSVMTFRMR